MQVLNGSGERGEAVRAAELSIDEQPILKSNSFGPGREASRSRVALEAGQHTLRVELRGKPDTQLTVSVRFVVGRLPDDRLFGLSNANAAPRGFSPNGDGILDATSLRAVVDVDPAIPGNSGNGVTFALRNIAFELADASTCQPVATVSQSGVPVTPGMPTTLAVPWDGRDAGGAIVSPGEFYFRAKAELVRSMGGQERVISEEVSRVALVRVIADAPGGAQHEGVVVHVRP